MAQIKSDFGDEKENTDPSRSLISLTDSHSTRISSTSKSRPRNKTGPSPRKLLRRISAADEVDREIEEADEESFQDAPGSRVANSHLSVPGTSLPETPSQSPNRRSVKRSRSPIVVVGGGNGGQPLIQIEPNSPTVTLTGPLPPPPPASNSGSTSTSNSAPGSPSPTPRRQLPQYHLQERHRQLLSTTTTTAITTTAITANVVHIDAQVVDLSRFVSSSTTGNNHTSSSWASAGTGVKHPGPAVAGGAGVRTIKPEEIEPITRVGKMVYDPVGMRWTRGRREPEFVEEDGTQPEDGDGEDDGDEEQEDLSEDPFRDIESLRDGTGELDSMRDAESETDGEDDERSNGTADNDLVDEEEEDDGFDFTAEDYQQEPPANQPRDYLTGNSDGESEQDEQYDEEPSASRRPVFDDRDDSEVERSQDEQDENPHPDNTSRSDLQRNFERPWDEPSVVYDNGQSLDFDATPRPSRHRQPPVSATTTPRPILIPSQSTPQPFPYPNPRGRPTIPAQRQPPNPPRSVLKQTPSGSGVNSVFRGAPVTPYGSGKGHRRSVSFSDGKTYGKIRGLGAERKDDGGTDEEAVGEGANGNHLEARRTVDKSVSLAPSVRTKRIAGLLDALGEQSESHLPFKLWGEF